MRSNQLLALILSLVACASAAPAQSALDVADRDRALVAALRYRAAHDADSVLVEGCSLRASDVPAPHDPDIATRVGSALNIGRIVVRHCYQWRDPLARAERRVPYLQLESASQHGDTVDLRFYTSRAAERWHEHVLLRLDGDSVHVLQFRKQTHERFVTRSIPAPPSSVAPRLREQVVQTVILHLWEGLGHLSNDSSDVFLRSASWPPAVGSWPTPAAAWLERVATAHGVQGDSASRRPRVSVLLGDIRQEGDTASADVLFAFGSWCAPRRAFLGGDAAFVYQFRRHGTGWEYVARDLRGQGDSLGCPDQVRADTLR